MKKYAVIDTETASLNGGVCELAVILVDENLNVLSEFCTLVNPIRKIMPDASKVHGITDEDVAGKPTLAEVIGELDSRDVIGHNVKFDLRMLHHVYRSERKVCTLDLARATIKDLDNYKLGTVAGHLGFEFKAHSALDDARASLTILRHCLAQRGQTLEELFTDLNGQQL